VTCPSSSCYERVCSPSVIIVEISLARPCDLSFCCYGRVCSLLELAAVKSIVAAKSVVCLSVVLIHTDSSRVCCTICCVDVQLAVGSIVV
jgi:hypothetical protein